jgi:hypothetical protein
MLPLFWKGRIIYDPGDHRLVFLHGRQHFPPHLRQHLFVVPGGVRHQVVQRLVHATNICGANRAAIGSTLLRSPANNNPVQ